MPTAKVVDTFKSKNCTVKARPYLKGTDLEEYILERTDYGVQLSQLYRLLERVMVFIRVNRQAQRYDVIAEETASDGSLIEVYAYWKKRNGFVQGRIYYDAKYMLPDENLCIISSRGNDQWREAFGKQVNVTSMAHAITVFSAFKFEPVHDAAGKVIGTKTILISVSEFGGTIPKFLVKKHTPKELNEFVEDMVIAGKREFPM